jgi:beta-1,4-mannosyl-glycoprotein beta-1,4-N-acetylglucosaminyltransferase
MKNQIKKYKVYDCFTYDGEDCLELRLRTHWSKVDWFVIAESNMTFSGLEKKISFDIKKYAWARSKIRFIKVDKKIFKECITAWDREIAQRNSLMLGYKDASDNDIVIISDVDEIINPDKINFIDKDTYLRFEQTVFYFYCDYICVLDPLITKAIAIRGDFAKKNLPHHMRDSCIDLQEIRIKQGGWHFSYLGGVNIINTKLERFSHQEFNFNKYKNQTINFNKIIRGEDIFGRLTYWGRVSKKHLTHYEMKKWFTKHPNFYAPRKIKYYGDAISVVNKSRGRLKITKSIIKKIIKIKNFIQP